MPAPFRPQNCPFACGYLESNVIHGSLGIPESTSRAVQPLLQGDRLPLVSFERRMLYGDAVTQLSSVDRNRAIAAQKQAKLDDDQQAQQSPSSYAGTTSNLHCYHIRDSVIMIALCNRADHYMFILFLSFFFFSFA